MHLWRRVAALLAGTSVSDADARASVPESCSLTFHLDDLLPA